MRIINRCKAPFDRRFAIFLNAATGGRITQVTVRKPKKGDEPFRATYQPTDNGAQMKIIIFYREGETTASMRLLFAHEVGHALISLGEEEPVCDAYAKYICDNYKHS